MTRDTTFKNKEWKWPINTDLYDQNPILSQSEQLELERILPNLELGRKYKIQTTSRNLDRLLKPIIDVLRYTNIPILDISGYSLLKLLLAEMYHREVSVWGLKETDWNDIICANSTIFFLRYPKAERSCRQYLMAIGYLLGGFKDIFAIGTFQKPSFAEKVFGKEWVFGAVKKICSEAVIWGYHLRRAEEDLPDLLCTALLVNRNPHIQSLTVECLNQLRNSVMSERLKKYLVLLSRILVSFGVIDTPLELKAGKGPWKPGALEGISPEWSNWCQRWINTSTLAPNTRRSLYGSLLRTGRWLAKVHPEITSPAQWTVELSYEFVAVVDQMKVGLWAHTTERFTPGIIGKPLSPRTKNTILGAVRIFFQDCQEWNWIPRAFDPHRVLSTPRSIRALIGPNPRAIADDVWAKLLWAGLNISPEDLPVFPTSLERCPVYPLEMIRALAIVWLFCGLRSDEIIRLRLGCVRWQQNDIVVEEVNQILPKDTICWLDIPVNKTGTSFTKPVDLVVGEAITAWEKIRPKQPPILDNKNGEIVDYLFAYRGRRINKTYINRTIIPLLCKKGGVPANDARGNITTHRARSTIASQLFNSKEPMPLWDLKEWLGHRYIGSTEHYVKTTPTRLAKAYYKADYFKQNLRTIEVLIDKDAITSGSAANGQPWLFYDLGHGYCTYDFFDQCPHRMACAKCSFYLPKGSTKAQILEAKANLQRMMQEIPLTEEELAAVEDGLTAINKLCEKLSDIPTPDGLTPRQLRKLG